jgi:triosephosphate isomerase
MASPIVAGNWKMNKTVEEARRAVVQMKPGLEAVKGVIKVVCPPYMALEAVGRLLRGTSIDLGAQNMHYESSGAYTGEISPPMLAGICQFVILGHSERRHIFGETDDSVGKKVEAAMAVGLRPIVCVGEKLEERERGAAKVVVEQQVRLGLDRVSSPGDLVVAYEPVWAIGTGRAATPDDAQAMMAHIRRTLAALYGDSAASEVPLLYGGSVNARNVADFVRREDVDGALVGGASLDPDSFVELVRNAAGALS